MFYVIYIRIFLFRLNITIIERYYGDDSAMFQVIGKSWSWGIIPYVGTLNSRKQHRKRYIDCERLKNMIK